MNYIISTFGLGRLLRQAQFLFVLLICCLASPAWAIDRTWTGEGLSSNWSEPENWLPKGIPQAGDNLIFDNLGSKRSNNNNLIGLRVFSIAFSISSMNIPWTLAAIALGSAAAPGLRPVRLTFGII